MQKVMLIGNLGRDPEVKYSQQGTAIAQFSIATTERWKDKAGELQEHTEWFAVKTFGRRAEIVGESLHKGSRVYLEGRKRTESWDDKQTGAKHYRDLVYVDRIEFLDSRSGGNGHREPAESGFDETAVTDQDVRSERSRFLRPFFRQQCRSDNVGLGLFTTVRNPFSAGGLEVVALLQLGVLGLACSKMGVSVASPIPQALVAFFFAAR